MNVTRRGRLREVLATLEEVAADEQSAFDNLPEGLQGSEQGQAIEAAASNLAEAITSVQAAVDGE